jgi:hypothetical protein
MTAIGADLPLLRRLANGEDCPIRDAAGGAGIGLVGEHADNTGMV